MCKAQELGLKNDIIVLGILLEIVKFEASAHFSSVKELDFAYFEGSCHHLFHTQWFLGMNIHE